MKILKVLFFLVIFFGLSAEFAYYWVERYYHSPTDFSGSGYVIIEKGAGVGKIANTLAADGIIKYPEVFKLMAQYKGRINPKFGEYQLAPELSPEEILEKMENGETISRKITVPEGKTVFDVMELLKNSEKLKLTISYTPSPVASPVVATTPPVNTAAPVTPAAKAVAALTTTAPTTPIPATPVEWPAEGSLMPSTYLYHYGDSDREIISQMQAQMAKNLDELWAKRAPDLPFTTKEQALALASVVEKETGGDQERKLVASVFLNRLKQGMKLESDPTAIYGLTHGAPLGRMPTAEDMKSENPYNTYVIPGLPPAPICNPGRPALEAVLQPVQSPYLFFVANGAGGHNFAATYAEHKLNIQKLRDHLKNQPN